MIEEDAVTCEKAVSLPVVDRNPVGINLSCAIGRTWVKRRGLPLRHLLDLAEHLRSRGLVELRFLLHPQNPDGFQDPQGSEGIGIGRVFGGFERDRHMALSGKVVYLVRLNFLN